MACHNISDSSWSQSALHPQLPQQHIKVKDMSGKYSHDVTGDGEVWIADEEAERIAAHLGMPLQRFHHQYVRAYSKVEGFKLLKAKNNPVSAAGALVCGAWLM